MDGLRIKVIVAFQSKRKNQALSNRKYSGIDGGFIQLYIYIQQHVDFWIVLQL